MKIQTRHVGRTGRFFFLFPEPVEAYTYDFWKDCGVIKTRMDFQTHVGIPYIILSLEML